MYRRSTAIQSMKKPGIQSISIRALLAVCVLCVAMRPVQAESSAVFDDLFKGRPGAFMAIDIDTGNVIAWHDPDSFLGQAFPGGSITKLFTAIAGIEDGILDGDTKFYCGPSSPGLPEIERCWDARGHGLIGLTDAIAYSCNRYFSRAAGYVNYASFADTLVDFRLLDSKPDVPPEEEARVSDMTGFGTSIRYAPLSLIAAVAAIHNGGRLFDYTVAPGGGPLKTGAMHRVDISPRAVKTIYTGMRGSAVYGTSSPAALRPGLTGIIGKTGTAEYFYRGKNGELKTHAWWTGIAGIRHTRMAVVVFLLEGNGSRDAAPLGGDILSQLLHHPVSTK